MNSTRPPISRIMPGPRAAAAMPRRASSSRSCWSAASSSISLRRPARSPLATRRSTSGGNWPLRSNASASDMPSRTRAATASSERRIGRRSTTSDAIFKASSKGTALAPSSASVRTKRALSAARSRRPSNGNRSRKACQRSRMTGCRRASITTTTAATITSSSGRPQRCMPSLIASNRRVASGSSPSKRLNTSITCGTTQTSSATTTAMATVDSSSG